MKRRPTHRQILGELMKKNVIPQEVRENSRDIEEIVVEAGGNPGCVNNASAR